MEIVLASLVLYNTMYIGSTYMYTPLPAKVKRGLTPNAVKFKIKLGLPFMVPVLLHKF